MAHHNEHDLRCIIGVRDGQRTALRELFERYTPFLYSVAFRLLEDLRGAEEAVQETWVHVWQHADDYKPRRETVSAWLLSTLRTCALELRRHPVPASDDEMSELVDAGASSIFCASTTRREHHDRVTRAFAELSESQREVLTRAFFDGMTQREIADAMNVSLATVKLRTRQGLMRLVAILPGEGAR